MDEVCINDGGANGVCGDVTCADASECAAAPATGTAPVACADLVGDGDGDCYLSCELGETCPDGMACQFGLLCMWPS
jgi:hypothetical protein